MVLLRICNVLLISTSEFNTTGSFLFIFNSFLADKQKPQGIKIHICSLLNIHKHETVVNRSAPFFAGIFCGRSLVVVHFGVILGYTPVVAQGDVGDTGQLAVMATIAKSALLSTTIRPKRVEAVWAAPTTTPPSSRTRSAKTVKIPPLEDCRRTDSSFAQAAAAFDTGRSLLRRGGLSWHGTVASPHGSPA